MQGQPVRGKPVRAMTLRLLAMAGGILLGAFTASAPVNAQVPAALAGTVTSTQEPVMEGVLVNIKREGSTITTTVVSNEKGRYAFPVDRIQPGKYTISIRAVDIADYCYTLPPGTIVG